MADHNDHKETKKYQKRDRNHSDHDAKRYLAPVDNPIYIEECGSCHIPYQPELLPSGSWEKITAVLDDHFGEELEINPESETELDKKNLIEAKNVLVDFLKSQKDPYIDALKHLHPSLRAKYKDRVTLWRKEFGAEALIEIKITSFVVKGQNKDEIVFYATLTDTTEGVDRNILTAFALKKTIETWKISRFVRDIKDLEKELEE